MASILISNIGTLVTGKLEDPLRKADSIYIEDGLVRAIGMRRAQVRRMVVVESVVIAVFGALLGVAVGSGLGTAVVRALKDQGIPELALPWASIGLFLGLAVVVGLVAAIIPAFRASRINVLNAIAYE